MKKLPLSFYLQILLCAALWGSAFPVIKLSFAHLALESYGEQLLFAGTRFILAGLLVMVFCRRSVFSTFREVPKGALLWVTLGQTFGQYVFFYYALRVSSGTLGALLVGSGSLWWVLLAPLFLKSAFPTGKQWMALLVCTIGISIAVYAPGAGSGDVLQGTIAFLMSTLMGAFGAIGMKRVAPRFGSRTITALSLFLGGLMLTVVGGFQWEAFSQDYNWVTLGVTVYLAILSATAFTLWNRLIERYSVNLLSGFRFMIPLCGVIESAVFLETETIGIGIVIGGAILLGSLFAMSRIEAKT
ncbi:MAG: DMT family transporter [Opitutaceae bacterium]|nr:DMT family transporter [Opitutaceae bacterium]